MLAFRSKRWLGGRSCAPAVETLTGQCVDTQQQPPQQVLLQLPHLVVPGPLQQQQLHITKKSPFVLAGLLAPAGIMPPPQQQQQKQQQQQGMPAHHSPFELRLPSLIVSATSGSSAGSNTAAQLQALLLGLPRPLSSSGAAATAPSSSALFGAWQSVATTAPSAAAHVQEEPFIQHQQQRQRRRRASSSSGLLGHQRSGPLAPVKPGKKKLHSSVRARQKLQALEAQHEAVLAAYEAEAALHAQLQLRWEAAAAQYDASLPALLQLQQQQQQQQQAASEGSGEHDAAASAAALVDQLTALLPALEAAQQQEGSSSSGGQGMLADTLAFASPPPLSASPSGDMLCSPFARVAAALPTGGGATTAVGCPCSRCKRPRHQQLPLPSDAWLLDAAAAAAAEDCDDDGGSFACDLALLLSASLSLDAPRAKQLRALGTRSCHHHSAAQRPATAGGSEPAAAAAGAHQQLAALLQQAGAAASCSRPERLLTLLAPAGNDCGPRAEGGRGSFMALLTQPTIGAAPTAGALGAAAGVTLSTEQRAVLQAVWDSAAAAHREAHAALRRAAAALQQAVVAGDGDTQHRSEQFSGLHAADAALHEMEAALCADARTAHDTLQRFWGSQSPLSLLQRVRCLAAAGPGSGGALPGYDALRQVLTS